MLVGQRKQTTQMFGSLGDTTMEPSWKQADVFPIIARIIEQAYSEQQRFITAQEIAARLLQDTEARNFVEAARTAGGEAVARMAGQQYGIVVQPAHHCRRIGVVRVFERANIDGLWAYKPV